MTESTTAIDVRGITKRFGDFTAVNGISFTVERGETLALLGPNGAGKSTLIRMLTTLMLPTSGTALVDGADIVQDPDTVRHAIGVIPQAMTSDMELSCRENLTIFAKLYSVPRERREKLIAELLDAVDLTQWADKQVKQLSGGMRRRLEIARGARARAEDFLPRRTHLRARSRLAPRTCGTCWSASSRSATSRCCSRRT